MNLPNIYSTQLNKSKLEKLKKKLQQLHFNCKNIFYVMNKLYNEPKLKKKGN